MNGRILSNWAVVVAATLLTAVASLVAEDLLPPLDHDRTFVWYRWVVLGALLLGLFLAVRWRSAVHRTTGTLFHVQVLDEVLADLSEASRRRAERDRMAIRSVTRWVDLRCRRDEHGTVDVVDLTQSLADILEGQINADLPDTGYTVAPVMPWPMALAVGTQLPIGHRLRLLELQDTTGKELNKTVLDEPPHADVHVEPTFETASPTQSGRVGVWIAVTEKGREDPGETFAELGVTHTVRLTLGPGLPPPGRVLSDDDLAGLGTALAAQLVAVCEAFPGAELVVVAMIPKIVAMATGWHLAQQRCRFFSRTHLLWWDPSERRLLPMRVRESQPHPVPLPVHA